MTDPKTLENEREFKALRAVHAQLGKAAKSEVAAPETLLRLLHRGGRLPRINPLVGIYNPVSAQTRLAFVYAASRADSTARERIPRCRRRSRRRR
ncbi:hypothetical protein [Nocardia salmonicida]|uniref:hypothetical protein n=1 Tax=Nocardia salmonicida TaxID=53431 RepID=UPI0037BC3EA7